MITGVSVKETSKRKTDCQTNKGQKRDMCYEDTWWNTYSETRVGILSEVLQVDPGLNVPIRPTCRSRRDLVR